MTKHMLVDATHPEETRVVIVNRNRIDAFDYTSPTKKQIKGNIYLAKITRVEPSLQAAFVEYGCGKQGFLPFAEIHPDYYQIPVSDRKRLMEEAAREIERAEREEEEEDQYRDEAPPAAPAEESWFSGDEQPHDEAHHEETALPSLPSISTEALREEDIPDAPSQEPIVTEAETETEIEPVIAAEEAAPETLEYQPLAAEEIAVQSDIVEPAAAVQEGEAPADAPAAEAAEAAPADEEETPRRRRTPFTRRYKIQEVIKRNQVVLVQVIKEERGNKGASLSTYMSLAGRYCVLMPNTPKGGGVSRKIANNEDRRRLKQISSDLKVSDDMSAIIRTAGTDRTRTEIKRDFDYLVKLWNSIRETTLASSAPALVYEESDLIKRSIRDLYQQDVEDIIVEGEDAFNRAKDFMKLMMPSHAPKVKLHTDGLPLFHEYNVEDQLQALYEPTAKLRSGGYLVINPTEAMVSIDVNSGRSTGERHIEETAIRTNMEAAEEVARQLRLRDLAGLIVIDFIDMVDGRNRRQVERALRDALRHDRAKIQVGRIGPFGLLELSRQRLRSSLVETSTASCSHCSGRGVVRTPTSLGLQILRNLEKEASAGIYGELRIKTLAPVATALFNEMRGKIQALETKYQLRVTVDIDPALSNLQPFKIEKQKKGSGDYEAEDRSERQERGERGERGGKRRRRERGGRDRYEAQEAPQPEPLELDEPIGGGVEEVESPGDQEPRERSRRGGRRRRGGRGRDRDNRDRSEQRNDAFAEGQQQSEGSDPVEGEPRDDNNAEAANGERQERGERGDRRRSRGGRGRNRWKNRRDREPRGDRPQGDETQSLREEQPYPSRGNDELRVVTPVVTQPSEHYHSTVIEPLQQPRSTHASEDHPSDDGSKRKGWWRRMVE